MELILDEHQQAAVDGVFESPYRVTAVVARAGCGKTTTTAAIIENMWRNGIRRDRTYAAAPTGKAAVVMGQALQGIDLINKPKTLHRLLGCRGAKWAFNRKNRLDCDLLVIDEAGMLDVEHAARMIYSISPEARILLVLDDEQLLSVGAGCPARDIVAANRPGQVFRLPINYRQMAGDPIACACESILAGKMPTFEGNFHFHPVGKAEDVPAAVASVAKEWYDAGDDWISLAPKKKGPAGIEAINQHLQAALNPEDKPGFDVFGGKIKEGDLVTHTKNNYDLDVFNGYIGRYIKKDGLRHKVVYNGEIYAYEKRADLDQVTLGYTTSIHKSQGSEYQKVIAVCCDAHSFMLCRSLLYVACSRAKKELHVIGSLDAVNKAVKRNVNDKRNTFLSLQLGGKQ